MTGAAATDIAATAFSHNDSSQQQSQQQISSTVTSPPPQIMTADLNSTTANSTATADSTTPAPLDATSVNADNTESNLKTLSVSLHLAKSSLHPGDKQIITIRAAGENSTDSVAGASVSGRITGPTGLVKKVEGTTDDNGKASYSWKVSDKYTTGKYKVKIEVSALGYENYLGSKTFKVTPIPVAVSNDNPISSSSVDSPIRITIPNYNIITSSSPVNVPDSTRSTSANTDNSHHSHHHDNPAAGVKDNGINSNDHSSSSIIRSANNGINGGDLAQKIINHVKDRLEIHGIRIP